MSSPQLPLSFSTGTPGPRPVPSPATLMPGPTGHHAVDAAVRAVANTAELPLAEQLEAYEAAHRTLREVLTAIDAA